MDVAMYARVLAHLLAVAWFVALFFLAHASEGRAIHITHTRVGRSAIVLLMAWFALLLLTVRGVAIMPREVIVPTLAALELGGWVLAWAWLLWCGSENFHIEFRRNNKTSLLLIAWLTVLFLG
jgi:hypothetical protein